MNLKENLGELVWSDLYRISSTKQKDNHVDHYFTSLKDLHGLDFIQLLNRWTMILYKDLPNIWNRVKNVFNNKSERSIDQNDKFYLVSVNSLNVIQVIDVLTNEIVLRQ